MEYVLSFAAGMAIALVVGSPLVLLATLIGAPFLRYPFTRWVAYLIWGLASAMTVFVAVYAASAIFQHWHSPFGVIGVCCASLPYVLNELVRFGQSSGMAPPGMALRFASFVGAVSAFAMAIWT